MESDSSAVSKGAGLIIEEQPFSGFAQITGGFWSSRTTKQHACGWIYEINILGVRKFHR